MSLSPEWYLPFRFSDQTSICTSQHEIYLCKKCTSRPNLQRILFGNTVPP
jgi:hypothetical protein